MKYKAIQFYRISSIIILLLIIVMVLSAYFKMDGYFTQYNIKDLTFEFQLFVWTIIFLSILSFFINWRLILTANTNSADKVDIINKIEENNINKKNTNYKEYKLDIESLFRTGLDITDNKEFIQKAISLLCRELDFDLAVSYKLNKENNKYENWVNYALFTDKMPEPFEIGNGLHGQVALNKEAIQLKDIPDDYIKIVSGSGNILPKNIYIIPIVANNTTTIVIEFADMKTRENNSFKILQDFANQYSNNVKG